MLDAAYKDRQVRLGMKIASPLVVVCLLFCCFVVVLYNNMIGGGYVVIVSIDYYMVDE